VSYSGKVYFCPFIRVEVGDLTTQTLQDVWTGEKYVSLRKKLVEEHLFRVCAAAAVRLSSHRSRRARPTRCRPIRSWPRWAHR
jgi:hypothetical protein